MSNILVPQPPMEDVSTGAPSEVVDGSKKMDKRTVNYRFGKDDSTCANCKQFLVPNQCIKVDGLINPTGMCDLFEASSANGSPDTSQLANELLAGTDDTNGGSANV